MQLKDVFSEQETKLTETKNSDQAASDAVFLISFYIGQTRFATLIDQVREIVEDATVTPLPIPNETYSGVLNLRGNLIPVLSPQRLLSAEASKIKLNSDESTQKRFVVFETKGKGAFAVEAAQVHKVECPQSEFKSITNGFSEVIRIQDSPTYLINFMEMEAEKILAAGDIK